MQSAAGGAEQSPGAGTRYRNGTGWICQPDLHLFSGTAECGKNPERTGWLHDFLRDSPVSLALAPAGHHRKQSGFSGRTLAGGALPRTCDGAGSGGCSGVFPLVCDALFFRCVLHVRSYVSDVLPPGGGEESNPGGNQEHGRNCAGQRVFFPQRDAQNLCAAVWNHAGRIPAVYRKE